MYLLLKILIYLRKKCRNGSIEEKVSDEAKYEKKSWSERYQHSLNLFFPFRKG